jgi:hypothetical protein
MKVEELKLEEIEVSHTLIEGVDDTLLSDTLVNRSHRICFLDLACTQVHGFFSQCQNYSQ